MAEGRRLRAALIIAGLGSILILVALLGDAGRFTGLGLLALGTVLAQSLAVRSTGAVTALDWWKLMAAGTALVAIGAPLALLTGSVGGLIAGIGAAVAMIGVVLGMPSSA